ncbi:hypothetical protein IWW45_005342 [Coemansia sp. RSA 485]|nr:hypothetical protein IWW45_005342 [Coemansia sp. RSA 485]
MLKLTHPPPPTLTFGTVGCYGRSAQDIVESEYVPAASMLGMVLFLIIISGFAKTVYIAIGFAYSGTLGFDNFSGLIAIGATVSRLLFSGAAAVEMSLTPNAVSPANIAVECQILGPAFVSAARSADATDILTVLGAAVAAPALSTVDCSNICRR